MVFLVLVFGRLCFSCAQTIMFFCALVCAWCLGDCAFVVLKQL